MSLDLWAARWGIHPFALEDLRRSLGAEPPPPAPDAAARSEAWAQSLVRIEAAALRCKLWRNNVGVLPDARGVPVRFGLANDSKTLNTILKSADLIGIKPVVVTPAMVGTTIGQFLSREIKTPGWKYNPNDAHEKAQMTWALMVQSLGGDAKFATGRGSIDT
mgnify:FL=1